MSFKIHTKFFEIPCGGLKKPSSCIFDDWPTFITLENPKSRKIIELEFPHNMHISTFYPQCLQRFTIEIPCSGFRGVPLTNCSILYSIYGQILVQKCQKSLKNNKIIILWEYAHLHCVLNTFTMFFFDGNPGFGGVMITKKIRTDRRTG